MSCEDFEPLITITYSYGKTYATRHRRNNADSVCGTAQRTFDSFGTIMDESEYKRRRRTHWAECVNDCGDYPIPTDHVCMKRWVQHGNEAARRTLHKMGEHDLAEHV